MKFYKDWGGGWGVGRLADTLPGNGTGRPLSRAASGVKTGRKYVAECAAKQDEALPSLLEVQTASHRRHTTMKCQDCQDAASNRRLKLGL